MKPTVREKTGRKAVTPVLTAEGGKCYPGALGSHHSSFFSITEETV